MKRHDVKLSSLHCALVLATIILVGALPASSEDHKDGFSDQWLDMRFDWVMRFDAKTQKSSLVMPSAPFQRVTAIDLRYRVKPHLAEGGTGELTRYETLFYNNGKPIGCRRHGDFRIKQFWQGAIYLQPSAERIEDTHAIAHAIVRTLVETLKKEATLTAVLAPRYIVAKLADELGHYSFYRTTDDEIDSGPGGVYLFLASGQTTDRTYLVYRPPGAPRHAGDQ